jgi:hypothetical protein
MSALRTRTARLVQERLTAAMICPEGLAAQARVDAYRAGCAAAGYTEADLLRDSEVVFWATPYRPGRHERWVAAMQELGL